MLEQPELFGVPVGRAKDDAVALGVFKYWAEARHRALGLNGAGPKQVPTKRRLARIRARLKEGYTPAELRRAIDGVLCSEFHLRGGYTDIELICRDQAHVEQYRAMKQAPAAGTADWGDAEAERILKRAQRG